MPGIPAPTVHKANRGKTSMTARSYFGGRIWIAEGSVYVKHGKSYNVFNAFPVSNEDKTDIVYWQPYTFKTSYGLTSEAALASLKDRLCKVVDKDVEYCKRDEEKKAKKQARIVTVELDDPCI